jgi:DNA-binding PadR family transcriptional regulator
VARTTDLTTPPLRPAVFHILLALAGRELHGLGIADEVERTSAKALQLGPGTLYRSLAEMADHDLVETVAAPAGADPRRKYYGITPEGRSLLGREAERLAAVLEEARARDVLPATP